jgi:hypothetical protein
VRPHRRAPQSPSSSGWCPCRPRGEAVGEQVPARGQRLVRARGGADRLADSSSRIDEDAELAARSRSCRRRRLARAVRPLPSSPLFAQPAWPSTRSSQTGRDTLSMIGGGRETAEPPFLLVPLAAADDPARRRIGGGLVRDSGLRLLQAPRLAEIELERVKPSPSHGRARRSGRNQRPSAPVDRYSAPAGLRSRARELRTRRPADDHAPKRTGARSIERIAVHIVDQRVGQAAGARTGPRARPEAFIYKPSD